MSSEASAAMLASAPAAAEKKWGDDALSTVDAIDTSVSERVWCTHQRNALAAPQKNTHTKRN